ncbi:uncharacterized protein BJX67DRAFT_179064 [Aspergillus lucknowensis]|uniref:Uncharacterized protein n=1 Tax=Aspergillus lucknowensis TaxID=176173 RepID=A0ABR4LM24_9EURO
MVWRLEYNQSVSLCGGQECWVVNERCETAGALVSTSQSGSCSSTTAAVAYVSRVRTGPVLSRSGNKENTDRKEGYCGRGRATSLNLIVQEEGRTTEASPLRQKTTKFRRGVGCFSEPKRDGENTTERNPSPPKAMGEESAGEAIQPSPPTQEC